MVGLFIDVTALVTVGLFIDVTAQGYKQDRGPEVMVGLSIDITELVTISGFIDGPVAQRSWRLEFRGSRSFHRCRKPNAMRNNGQER